VLSQDYPDFEVIAIDDRSTDRTGAILDREAAQNPALRVIHLQALPPGWLGKNHALQKGAEAASGSLILFTDADVVMDPSALRRAAFYLESNRLDHLAIAPRAPVPGFLSNAFLGVFATMFTLYTKPWKVSDPDSKKHIGNCAASGQTFCLVLNS
jgi:glycosyltransferase involved in cell wall biosynthesis